MGTRQQARSAIENWIISWETNAVPDYEAALRFIRWNVDNILHHSIRYENGVAHLNPPLVNRIRDSGNLGALVNSVDAQTRALQFHLAMFNQLRQTWAQHVPYLLATDQEFTVHWNGTMHRFSQLYQQLIDAQRRVGHASTLITDLLMQAQPPPDTADQDAIDNYAWEGALMHQDRPERAPRPVGGRQWDAPLVRGLPYDSDIESNESDSGDED